MKPLSALAVFLLAIVSAPSAAGQACYTPVTSWQGTYNWTGSGGGSDKFGDYTWTVSHQATGAPNLVLSGASCSSVAFGGPDASVTGSATDMGTNKCGDGSPDTEAFSGGPTFLTEGVLTLNIAGSTFQYFEDPIVTVQETSNTCGTINHSQLPLQIAPFDPGCTGVLTLPSTSLPATIQTLTGEIPYSGVADCPFAIASTWSLAYDLTPIFKDDDDCKKNGGSTVGCRNQSLGEDVAIVGTGFSLHYEGSRQTTGGADTVASTDAMMIGGWTLSVHHAYNPGNNTLYLGNGNQRNGYRIGTPVSYLGNTLITSEAGDEVYVFSSTGQHLQTLKPLTGAPLYLFGYDSKGNLITVTDANSNVTMIRRNASGNVTGIVSPFGLTTGITLDKNGFVSQIKDPLGNLSSYTIVGGLMISRVDARGNTYNYTYDGNGLLLKDADPLGGFHGLNRTNATTGLGWTVGHSTAMGVTSSFKSTVTTPWTQDPNHPNFTEQTTNIWPNGLQYTNSISAQSGKTTIGTSLPNATSVSTTQGPDPIWGLQTPVTTSASLTKGTLTMLRTSTRTATLGSVGNPFSVSTETDTDTVNGRVYTSVFNAAAHTYVYTSPVHRAVTAMFDSQERIVSTQPAGLTASTVAYATNGKLASLTQGTRKTSFTYTSRGFPATVTDPLRLRTALSYDTAGHVLSSTLPDGRITSRTYDANGNLLTITPPGKSAHTFTYNSVDLPDSYTPPGGAPATTFTYDLDRRLTALTRPGGQTVSYTFDTAGRVTKISAPGGASDSLAYSSTTANITSASRGTERVAYSYNGPLLTKSTWSGSVAGNWSRVFNNNFWVTSRSVNGGTPVAFHYDNDGLLTAAGGMTVKRSASSGLITGTTLGLVSDTRTYNTFGELTGYSASINGTAAYTFKLTLNADAMTTAKSETIEGATNNYAYTYDLANRLTGASKNASAASYTYDSNSNRLTAVNGSGTTSATYDAQDRLVTYGSTAYTYNLAGDTTSQKTGTQKTSYTYDALGNLTAVTLPNGTNITYVIDGENNRVGKAVNGVATAGFLYEDDRIVAQLNGSNQLVSQFVYASGLGSPDYMISGTSVYRIVHDPVGSPVLVVDTSTGAIAEQITYDEFGNVLADTNPGLQPFGFAGGLYDLDTKLVRFGARDYNPAVGRWTVKDPTLFRGGDTNVYSYAHSDPVNHTDLTGLGDCDEKEKTDEEKKKDAEKKEEDLLHKIIHAITGDKVKVGPVNISTDKPAVSVGTSVGVTVEGQTVAQATGEVEVGITPTPDPAAPFIYIDTDVAIKIGGHTIWENKTHTEAGRAKTWRPWVDGFGKHLSDVEKAACETCSDGVPQP